MNQIFEPAIGILNIVTKTLIFLFVILLITTSVINFYYRNRIMDGVYVAGVDLSGKTRDEGLHTISNSFTPPGRLKLVFESNQYEMDLPDLGFSYDFDLTLNEAFNQYRSGGKIQNMLGVFKSYRSQKTIGLKYRINSQKLKEYTGVLSSKIDVESVEPKISVTDSKVVVSKGSMGKKVNSDLLIGLINKALSQAKFSPIEIPVDQTGKNVSDEELMSLETRAKNILGKNIVIEWDKNSLAIDGEQLLAFLEPQGFSQAEIMKFVEGDLDAKISRAPQNAVFKEEGGKVTEFKPAKNGLILNKTDLIQNIKNSLQQLEMKGNSSETVVATTDKVAASVTTEEVNSLGIKELLGAGESKFKGSIPGRIHNVTLASQKLNGVLIPPGQTSSFNEILGDISSFTGYKQAYIIKDGKTILGDGGGVCQTSTTLFRAVLSAGLPIVERKAHAYRVGYYEQDSSPGLDATVFSPTTDLKFKNDTPAYILIQTSVDSKNLALTYEIYGTSDGRSSIISKPIVASQTAPPEDLYVDDPNLPAGKIQQIEHKAWGAKVVFDYKVKRGEETVFEKTFVSNYRPWQAVYLKGTGPVN